MRRTSSRIRGQVVCLGLVVVPKPGKLAEAARLLALDERLELGQPEGHRLPACTVTAVGKEEALLDEIASLEPVLAAEVVYAELLAGEEVA